MGQATKDKSSAWPTGYTKLITHVGLPLSPLTHFPTIQSPIFLKSISSIILSFCCSILILCKEKLVKTFSTSPLLLKPSSAYRATFYILRTSLQTHSPCITCVLPIFLSSSSPFHTLLLSTSSSCAIHFSANTFLHQLKASFTTFLKIIKL